MLALAEIGAPLFHHNIIRAFESPRQDVLQDVLSSARNSLYGETRRISMHIGENLSDCSQFISPKMDRISNFYPMAPASSIRTAALGGDALFAMLAQFLRRYKVRTQVNRKSSTIPQAFLGLAMLSQPDRQSCIPVDDDREYVDHRKRRRNRTTLSCLNCHGSKRMCDRKRPACGRCTKLGLTGTCVYEVDDLNRRDTSNDEILLLKSRIAELEGFIREYKKKPHPRTTSQRGRAASVTSTFFCSDSGSSTGSRSTSPGPLLTNFNMRNEASSESDNDPRTPSSQTAEQPIFLRSAESTSNATCHQSPVSLYPTSVKPDSDNNFGIDIDSAFDLGTSSLFSEDNETLERVFARIMQQEATEHCPARDCGCMGQPSGHSAVIELAPHLRRALDALRTVQIHRTQATEFGTPCLILNQLQALTDLVSSILESSSASAHSSATPDATQPQVTLNASVGPTPSSADSPLQRVLAARRASLASSSSSVSQAAVSNRQFWRDATTQPAWESNQSSPIPNSNSAEKDSFMSWEVPTRFGWPSTISL